MTPIVKAFCTDSAFEIASLGVQIFGGHGYIRENGMEQYVCDARIGMLYEGTNGIQAVDLIGRKLPMESGRLLQSFFGPVQAYIEQYKNDENMAEFIAPLEKAFGRLQQATGLIAQKAPADYNEPGASVVDYLKLFALVTHAYVWCLAPQVAMGKLSSSEKAFYQSKIETARFVMQKILPQTRTFYANIAAGAGPLMDFNDDRFGAF